METNSKHHSFWITEDEREILRAAARKRDIGVGLLSRALVLHGLERIDQKVVMARIEREREAAQERLEQRARIANMARWDKGE